MALKFGTTGIFVNLYRSPFHVVFRRRIHNRWDRFDVLKPQDKIDAVVAVIEELVKEDSAFPEKLIAVDMECFRSSSHRKRYLYP